MYKIQNYTDLFFYFRFDDSRTCVHRFTNHALVYVYGGELEMTASDQTVTVRSGEAVFVRKETCLRMAVSWQKNKETKMAILRIPESFLREFFFTIERLGKITDAPDQSIFFIPQREDIDSLFCSITPYYGVDIVPGEKILKLKIIEAIYALLGTNRLFHTLLFGFAYGSGINVFDLLADTCIYPFHWHRNRAAQIEPDNKLN